VLSSVIFGGVLRVGRELGYGLGGSPAPDDGAVRVIGIVMGSGTVLEREVAFEVLGSWTVSLKAGVLYI
jgi:hypothetical protein